MVEAAEKRGYRGVQESIRNRILKGEWRVGGKIPSERALEKQLRISRLTISKGLAHLVAEGLLVRKRGKGTFVSEGLASAHTKSRWIKFISPVGGSGRNPTRHGVMEGMYEALAGDGFHVGIDFYKSAEEQVGLLKRNGQEDLAGLVVWFTPEAENVAELLRLKAKQYPFVLVDSYPMDFEADFAVTDNLEGSRLVVDYLAGLGHRRIAYVTRPVDRSSLRDRQTGFLQGLVTHGLPFDSSGIVTLRQTGLEASDEVGAAVDRLLERRPAPTAIFFSNDDLALAAVGHLRGKGIQVPGDVSIVGYDNIDESEHGPVPLTTVMQDFFQMGKTAGEILSERLKGNSASRPLRVFLKPTLVIRASVREVVNDQ